MDGRWEFWIDRGGTFTDVVARRPAGTLAATHPPPQRRGEPTVLVISRGFRDALRIGYQNRPRIFARQIILPELLYHRVIEVSERVSADGELIEPLDEQGAARDLRAAYADGLRAGAGV